MNTNKLLSVLGTVLFISLSINIFMAGMMAGNSVGTSHKVTSDIETQDQKLREGLSDADKVILKQSMDTVREKLTKLHDDVENIKKAIRELIKKDPMDEKALNTALESEKNKKLEMVHLVHAARQDAMKKMSPEGQAALLKLSRLGFNLSNNAQNN